MNVLAGIFWFIMVIQSGDLAGTYAPIRLSTYDQCVRLGEALASILTQDHWLVCQSETTGQVNATWWAGPGADWGYNAQVSDR